MRTEFAMPALSLQCLVSLLASPAGHVQLLVTEFFSRLVVCDGVGSNLNMQLWQLGILEPTITLLSFSWWPPAAAILQGMCSTSKASRLQAVNMGARPPLVALITCMASSPNTVLEVRRNAEHALKALDKLAEKLPAGGRHSLNSRARLL